MPELKIFISSPGDVPDERLRADLVVDKLAQDYSRFFTLSTYRWEHEPMLASGHFQDAIEPPSATDIVILIVWSRLGTPLPEKTSVREYRGIDGRAPVTGTEWEYEDALAAARANGSPGILAFRNRRPAPIDTCNPEARAKTLAQLDALDVFWRRHFEDRGVFLAAFEGYQTLEEFGALLEQKLRKLIEKRITTATAAAPAAGWTGAPFRGLQAYEFEHAAIFFGRDAIVARAARHIAMAARHDNAFLLIAGASGSGKSSLVKAALVPRLMKPQRIEGLAFLRRVVFKPSDAHGDVFAGLVDALVRSGEGVGLPELLSPGQTAADLTSHLRVVADDPRFVFAAALGRVTEDARKAGRVLEHEQARAILVVDQLEELFTRDAISAYDRTVFVQLLASLAKSGLVWVIATMRSDFWHRIADLPVLLALVEGERRLDVAAPSPLELHDMIRKPVEAKGLAFENDPESGIGLDEALAKQAAAEPGVLPLLSFTLEAIFAEDVLKNGGRMLTYGTYNALGRLEGAIATRAETIVGDLPGPVQNAVPRVLRALITVSDGVDAIAVARTAPLESFVPGSAARQVVDALTTGRLLVASGDGLRANVRVAHEAVIGRWKRAEAQVALDRRDLETRKLVERQYERWNKADGTTKPDLLLRDPDLTNAVDLQTRWGDDIHAEYGAFIDRSAMAAKSAARRRVAAAGVVMILLLLLTALSLGGLAIAEMQRNTALVAQSRSLARDADTAAGQGDTTLATLLALAALPRSLNNPDRPIVLDAEYALANAFANRRERAVLRHDGIVNAIAFSPDGTRLATASDDKTAIIWDATTGGLISKLAGHFDKVNSVEFSHDGRRAVTGSDDGTALVWDVATGHHMPALNAHVGRIFYATFSPDDTRILVASEQAAGIFDVTTGERTSLLSIPGAQILGATFSPDGTKVAIGADDAAVHLWSADGKILQSLQNPGTEVTALSFSSDGRRLVAASDDGTARVWDVASARKVSDLIGHAARINSAVFSADGRSVLTASDDHTARLWNPDNGAKLLALLGHDGVVYSAAFSFDGNRAITASEDKTARVWDTHKGLVTAVLGGHGQAVKSALFSADGRRLATASDENVARLWNAGTSSAVAVYQGTSSPGVGAFSPDGSLVATGSDDGTLHIFDGRTGVEKARWPGSKGPVRSISFSPDGRLVVTTGDQVRIWRVANGAVRMLSEQGSAIRSAHFSPDGQRIAMVQDGKTVGILNVSSGKQLYLLAPDGSINDAEFSPDSARIVTISSDGTGHLWDATSGKSIGVLAHGMKLLDGASFSPDGERIATAGGNAAQLWDGRTGAFIAILSSGGATVTSVAFSPDGTMVATASIDHLVRLWNAKTGADLRVLSGHALPVRSVSFSPDGTHLLTASDDQTSRYWDVASGKTVAVLAGHEDSVVSAAFSSNGRMALTTSTDATVRLWTLPPLCQNLTDAAHLVLSRHLTSEERSRYFLGAQDIGWSERLHDLSAPLLALVIPKSGDSCH